MSKVARGPRSSTAGAPQDGCIAPVRGLALPLAGVRYSARPSGACRSRGSGPQDKDIGRSMRRPASAMVVPGLCIQASTGPRRYRPDGRLPSEPRPRAPPNADRTAVDALARLRAHPATMRLHCFDRQAAMGCARNCTAATKCRVPAGPIYLALLNPRHRQLSKRHVMRM
jgi:hypothetical protein